MQKVLILLSTYNGEKYLEEQLSSFLFQREITTRLLVRDDGSSDNTLKILKKFQKEHSETIEDIIEGKNNGSTSSFCELMKLAYTNYSNEYDFYAFADQDDYWMEDKLCQAVRKLEQFDATKPNMYCSDKIIVDSNLNRISGIRPAIVELTKGRALARNIATGCTMVFNLRALELFATSETKFIKIHDYAIFLICSFLGNVFYDQNAYILYRQHGSNQLGGIDTIGARTWDRLRKKGNLNEHFQERTASAFFDTYKDLLSEEDKRLVLIMALYRKNLSCKLKLLFSREISKERLEDNFFFKLKVLLGGA